MPLTSNPSPSKRPSSPGECCRNDEWLVKQSRTGSWGNVCPGIQAVHGDTAICHTCSAWLTWGRPCGPGGNPDKVSMHNTTTPQYESDRRQV